MFNGLGRCGSRLLSTPVAWKCLPIRCATPLQLTLQLRPAGGKSFPPAFTSTVNQEQFLNGTSAAYIEAMYDSWLLDRNSVRVSWQAFFENCAADRPPGAAYQAPPVLSVPGNNEMIYTSRVNQEQFLNGASAAYIEAMRDSWLLDRNSVNVSWQVFFENGAAADRPRGAAYQAPPVPGNNEMMKYTWSDAPSGQSKDSNKVTAAGPQTTTDGQSSVVRSAIEAFQTRGHLAARIDPLRRSKIDLNANHLAEVVYQSSPPFADSDMSSVFKLPPTTLVGGKDDSLPLKEILTRLENVYCRSIGVEYMHIDSAERCKWIRERVEVTDKMVLDKEEKIRVFTRLARATGFEAFLARKWSSEKRFGLEGCEVLIPAMNEIIDKSSAYGVDSVFIGMPHRGRLNVLANVCHKPLSTLLEQFHGLEAGDEGSGDVKYHLGAFVEHTNEMTNKKMKLALVANPSHLEAVDSVVQGKTRAEQFSRGDAKGNEVMSILLHGDSSFSGQGVVYETFNLSDLPDYTTHGTIHIVVNNQVGFTTEPQVSRSSPYCTDVAKIVDAPIFHVNANDPEAVIHVCKIAAEWRNTFKKDVVIDLVAYRRNGHNEVDEPMFTQPFMYKVIKKTLPVLDMYGGTLIHEKVLTIEDVKINKDAYEQSCEEAYLISQKATRIKYEDWLDSPWPGFFKENKLDNAIKTGVTEETLKHIGKLFSSVSPDDEKFVVHKSIERIFKGRQQMINDRHVDWALAEAMAFGSLLKDGTHVRLSGQDVERGTFSHRHHVLHNQEVDKSTYRPLCNLYKDQAQYTVCNSSLSEYAVLGFELGFSMTNPNALVCWEAQFGDFNNTAQCIIDQFISSGQAKWMRQAGLVMLLPHGYEGMGPEHSSARLERFLQMSSEDPDVFPEKNEHFAIKQLNEINWIIANCSTPANYFHILRRQTALPFRKPLVIMTPKSLLRHPDAKSSFDEMTENTEFLRVIPEDGNAAKNASAVKRLIFCSGKVYYELIKEREDRKLSDSVAICRVEQISPFPFDLVEEECSKYENADVIWTQEEPKNQGAWFFVQPRFHTILHKSIGYVGRPVAASPATGNKVQHVKEIKKFIDESFTI